jgi:prefoldin subunit 5
MEHLKIPLSDKEEAILQLMRQVRNLEEENTNLRQELKQLYWRLQEHD